MHQYIPDLIYNAQLLEKTDEILTKRREAEEAESCSEACLTIEDVLAGLPIALRAQLFKSGAGFTQ